MKNKQTKTPDNQEDIKLTSRFWTWVKEKWNWVATPSAIIVGIGQLTSPPSPHSPLLTTALRFYFMPTFTLTSTPFTVHLLSLTLHTFTLTNTPFTLAVHLLSLTLQISLLSFTSCTLCNFPTIHIHPLPPTAVNHFRVLLPWPPP